MSRNVAALVKPPAPVRHDLVTWTADEVRTFLAAVEGDRMAPAYRLLASTGMRRGEALGLHWANVDLDAARIVVNRSLTLVNEELVWASPKTARSRRSSFVGSRDGGGASRRIGAGSSRNGLNAGEAWQDNDLVFCNEDGSALHPSRFTRRFVTACERAGVPKIRLHDLRHTWATLALQAGIHPKVVSERLGHATTGITLDIYSHVQPELDAHAATAVAELFGDKKPMKKSVTRSLKSGDRCGLTPRRLRAREDTHVAEVSVRKVWTGRFNGRLYRRSYRRAQQPTAQDVCARPLQRWSVPEVCTVAPYRPTAQDACAVRPVARFRRVRRTGAVPGVVQGVLSGGTRRNVSPCPERQG